MDYSTVLCSTISFIEARIREAADYKSLARFVGFSYRHLREVFREETGISLSRYILSRRIANAAYEIAHTSRSLTDIAGEFGFESYDVFTRAFRRETGMTPSRFRQEEIPVGRRRIGVGIYGPALLENSSSLFPFPEDSSMENKVLKTQESCNLYGISKVEYCYEEATPFPSCLRACLNYLGQNIYYAALMAATGAAFRFRWNPEAWDAGNIDARVIYPDPWEVFRRGFTAAGRNVTFLGRENSSKEDFIRFIRREIDQGRPVIALGIIGPPEACIITGYMEEGNALLGWNFFQNDLELMKGSEIHESGYFLCRNWWENDETKLLMAVGEMQGTPLSVSSILSNAADLLANERIETQTPDGASTGQVYLGGPAAFDAWAAALGDDRQFSSHLLFPLMVERLMAQNDAQNMITEGRSYAAFYLDWVGQEYPQAAVLCREAAEAFRTAAGLGFEMGRIRGSCQHDEKAAENLADPAVRQKLVPLILQVKELDSRACGLIREILKFI